MKETFFENHHFSFRLRKPSFWWEVWVARNEAGLRRFPARLRLQNQTTFWNFKQHFLLPEGPIVYREGLFKDNAFLKECIQPPEEFQTRQTIKLLHPMSGKLFKNPKYCSLTLKNMKNQSILNYSENSSALLRTNHQTPLVSTF